MNFLPGIPRSPFAKSARRVIDAEHNVGFARIWPPSAPPPGLPRAQWEPFLVSRLCAAMPDVAASWRPRLKAIDPSLTLDVTTVFTHQTPMVRWTTTKHGTHDILGDTCELADILICFIDRRRIPNLGNAILVQAKQADGLRVKLKKDEKAQFDLLSARPVFDGVAKGSPQNVNLQAYTPDVGLLYGLNQPDIDPPLLPLRATNRWSTSRGLSSRVGLYTVNAPYGLGKTLVDLIQGRVGWEFELPPANQVWSYFASPHHRHDWSMLVNYLIEVTWNGKPKLVTPRGKSSRMYFVSPSLRGHSRYVMADHDPVGRQTTPPFWPWPGRWLEEHGIPQFGLGGPDLEWPWDFLSDDGPRNPRFPSMQVGEDIEDDGISLVLFELGSVDGRREQSME